MADKTLEYQGQSIVIRYAVTRCIHAAECVRGLPQVFDPQRKPWIDPQAADLEQIAEVIERCPTGALTYERLDGGAGEIGDPLNSIAIQADGPLYLRGDIELTDDLGVAHRFKRLALCRCGASAHKPYCDGSHTKAGFADPGQLAPVESAAESVVEPGELRINCRKDGPLIFEGSVQISPCEGESLVKPAGALCRCGHSANKPFCDGSHRKVGFSSGD